MRHLLLTVSIVLISGCGPKEEAPSAESSAPAVAAVVVEPVSIVDGVVVVEMTANDQMRYNLETFTVKAGQPVKIVLKNIGRMPKAAMGHNLVILQADANVDTFVAAAAQAKANEYIPESAASVILEHTKMLGPGETDTIEFTAPAAGAYPFVCSFPAHLYAGMRGVMVVE